LREKRRIKQQRFRVESRSSEAAPEHASLLIARGGTRQTAAACSRDKPDRSRRPSAARSMRARRSATANEQRGARTIFRASIGQEHASMPGERAFRR
jgi:hypothetical protein